MTAHCADHLSFRIAPGWQRRFKAMVVGFGAVLATLALLAQAPASAQDEERPLDERDWVLGNVLTVLLHEVGHGLVALWALPVLGREEDAADSFSITYLLDTIADDASLGPEKIEQLDDALFVTAGAWLAYAEGNDLADTSLYAVEHSLDMQRFFAHMCLLVGREPDVYGSWLEDFDIEPEALDLERCEETALLQAEDWRYLLEVERDESWKDQGSRGLTLIIEPGKTKAHRRYEAWLKDWPWLRYFEQRLEGDLKLPEPLTIRFDACDEANAFYDHEEREILMCYELLADLEALY